LPKLTTEYASKAASCHQLTCGPAVALLASEICQWF
jgi:hypothetical protein